MIWNRVIRRVRNAFNLDLEDGSPTRYKILRRNLVILMDVLTIVPLVLMAAINYHQYRRVLSQELTSPLQNIVNKAKHSFEVFIAERQSAISFIAGAYGKQELADPNRLQYIFRVLRREFPGFVDLGLIDSRGIQVNYVGPYDFKGKDYSDQRWLHEVHIRGSYVSDVFLGHRGFPHLVIAVEQVAEGGEPWVLRSTIDTQKLDELIASMALELDSDAFLINRDGVFQTPSRFYGKVLETWPFSIPPVSYQANVITTVDPSGQPIIICYAYFVNHNFILVVVKRQADVLKAWITFKSELLVLFVVAVSLIFFVVWWLTGIVIRKVKEADERREAAYREMQYQNKLSSIGRLAAGVAHEINNPMAIINEKAGLMRDLLKKMPEIPYREKFEQSIAAILQSVDRCRNITHRLLGFARRMDVHIEVLDINEVIEEVLGFLEKEAIYRNIDLRLNPAQDLPKISSDRGQLQQVFLNILNNAFEAVPERGWVSVTTREVDSERIAVSIQDNGPGMSPEVLERIFEPFFTTKKISGTGLGLSITYGIVQKLGGKIEVESEVGQGTTFTVFLPKRASGLGEDQG